jgi:mannose-6-phosphate isomerase-like protein (cupin superfamily)
MEGRMPTIIDLNAEAAKLAALRGRAPLTTAGKRKGCMARLGAYRDGILLLGTSAGTGPGHWETHSEDELIHILDGTRTLEIVCDDGPPRSFDLRAGTIAVVPKGAWHRFHSVGVAMVLSAVLPGEHIDLDVDDPRTSTPGLEIVDTTRPPSMIDLNAEVAKLIMCRRTPQSTMADRKGSVARLAAYRDGLLLAIKFSGKDHWEAHTGDELIHILDGAATLEIVCDDGPPRSFVLRAGMVAVIPRGAWHRFHSSEGATQMAVTPFPGEHIGLDVDDPRTVERKPAQDA